MPDLNEIRVDIATLRMHLAQLQKDGYDSIGVTNLLIFIRDSIPTEIYADKVKPTRATSGK